MTPTVSASATVTASPEEVFAFLSDLENHWLLADRYVEVIELSRDADGVCRGGRVRLCGPGGIRRTAATRLSEARAGKVSGTARLGRSTWGSVRWAITPAGAGSTVSLEAEVQSAGALDRALLLAGGRVWLARRFGEALARLSEVLAQRS